MLQAGVREKTLMMHPRIVDNTVRISPLAPKFGGVDFWALLNQGMNANFAHIQKAV
jgi:hypothetical protein